jgi:hypothetical protein
MTSRSARTQLQLVDGLTSEQQLLHNFTVHLPLVAMPAAGMHRYGYKHAHLRPKALSAAGTAVLLQSGGLAPSWCTAGLVASADQFGCMEHSFRAIYDYEVVESHG